MGSPSIVQIEVLRPATAVLSAFSISAGIFAAIDDTFCKKTGRHIPGVKILHNPMSPAFHVNLCYGLRFVQISVLVIPPKRQKPPALCRYVSISRRRPISRGKMPRRKSCEAYKEERSNERYRWPV